MDNPYQIKTEFTVWEASAAILGIKRNHADDFPEIQPVAIELIRSIERKEIAVRELVPPDQYVIITTSSGMQADLHGLYFSAITRRDLLTWCDARGVRPSLLFADAEKQQDQTDESQPLDSSTGGDHIKVMLKEAGRNGAMQQHASRNSLYHQAKKIAMDLWRNGDPRQHSVMADYIKSLPEFSSLSKATLLEKLKEVANAINRPDLVRGTKKLPR